MNRWQWATRRTLIALGVPGIIGSVMMIAAVIIYCTAIRADERDILNLQQAIAQLRSQPQADRTEVPEATLDSFYDFFPPRSVLAEQLRTLHKLASERALTIEHVDYKLSRITGTPLLRYQVTFPLNTDYATLRHYLADVLVALPNAALEDLDIQRADADAELLEEKIGLVLFLRESNT